MLFQDSQSDWTADGKFWIRTGPAQQENKDPPSQEAGRAAEFSPHPPRWPIQALTDPPGKQGPAAASGPRRGLTWLLPTPKELKTLSATPLSTAGVIQPETLQGDTPPLPKG